MEKKLIYKSELTAHTKEGIGYITQQYLSEKNNTLVLSEKVHAVVGEEVYYCFHCGAEWMNILLQNDFIFSTLKSHESDSAEPLEFRSSAKRPVCISCQSEDSELVKKTDFLKK